MRLLNSRTFELKYFISETPQYAILSHRWFDKELAFADVSGSGGAELIKTSTSDSARKIRGCCAQAVLDGYDWVWIDTCCIDKSSSAELSESINSMYRWYEQSAVCYAYLWDVKARPTYPVLDIESFRRSAWFVRGWTLQELIAPASVEFYSCEWVELGTRRSLVHIVHDITQIRMDVLRKKMLPSSCCVGERMSWAAGRSTTRIEDEAYSLLGLFDINMPLLYGEGRRAFYRLQEEILKSKEDYSILAWCRQPELPQDFARAIRRLGRVSNTEPSSALPSQADGFRYVCHDRSSGCLTTRCHSRANPPSQDLKLDSLHSYAFPWKYVINYAPEAWKGEPFAVPLLGDRAGLDALSVATDPPRLTSRGWSMHLLASREQDSQQQDYSAVDEQPCLAWTFCILRMPDASDMLICIRLDLGNGVRTDPDTLLLLPVTELSRFQFKPRRFILKTTDAIRSYQHPLRTSPVHLDVVCHGGELDAEIYWVSKSSAALRGKELFNLDKQMAEFRIAVMRSKGAAIDFAVRLSPKSDDTCIPRTTPYTLAIRLVFHAISPEGIGVCLKCAQLPAELAGSKKTPQTWIEANWDQNAADSRGSDTDRHLQPIGNGEAVLIGAKLGLADMKWVPSKKLIVRVHFKIVKHEAPS